MKTTASELQDLIDRLRGIYRIPITDGLGPAGGDEPDNPDYFVRTFETSLIHKEAASAIEYLLLQTLAQESEINSLKEECNELEIELERLNL